jgi:N-acetylmuramoyl-L-alanine amidase
MGDSRAEGAAKEPRLNVDMNVLTQAMWSGGRWIAVALVGLGVSGIAVGAGPRGMTKSKPAMVSPWDAAVRARALFEAEPKGRHTKAEYAKVLDKFRAIYHDAPASSHAGHAVEQVAELLAEQGHELDDRKSLHDAAKQYEFLAKAYPGPGQSPVALGKALDLLGPDEAGDAAEAKVVWAQLLAEYPKSAAAREAGSREQGVGSRKAGVLTSHLSDSEAVAKVGHSKVVGLAEPTSQKRDVGHPVVATVTAIRHWSTGTYTRVAIDLGPEAGDDLAYQAVRVRNPDRIFFDLKHVKLSPELTGKTFSVTDGGFLSSIRAAQLQGDSTRVVLDVHEVGQYSAFLLPNPERLIIDIHGRAEKQGVGNREQGVGTTNSLAAFSAPVESASIPPASVRASGVTVSSLPPMPVTDGSASFGLAPASGARTNVAQPRVVIPTRPTTAKPVPNTVTKSSVDSGTDVAAVSDQPGRVAATRRPTSLPVASSRSLSVAASAEGDHYRSPRMLAAANAAAVGPASTKKDALKPEPVEAAPPIADASGSASERTLMRALGLKIGRIVIDAGHGGHDSGTLGVGGIQEKDVVLDVALRLGKLLHDRLGAEIVYTRADDTFIPLETRTAIANKAQADLFISVHANSSPDASARGVEVYYLNFTSDPDAMNVASRENAVSTQSVHELSDLVKKIALKDKIDESRELAADVDTSLYGGLTKGNAGLKDRGVKKAPFVVLIGANMPSILAEISFVTNPDDADQLQTPEYRERVAESLYKGVANYAGAINGAKSGSKGKAVVTERAAR